MLQPWRPRKAASREVSQGRDRDEAGSRRAQPPERSADLVGTDPQSRHSPPLPAGSAAPDPGSERSGGEQRERQPRGTELPRAAEAGAKWAQVTQGQAGAWALQREGSRGASSGHTPCPHADTPGHQEGMARPSVLVEMDRALLLSTAWHCLGASGRVTWLGCSPPREAWAALGSTFSFSYFLQ